MATATNDTTVEPDIASALSGFDKNSIRAILKRTKQPDLSHLPGSPGLPLVGHVPSVMLDSKKWLAEQHALHGPIFKFKAFNQEVVVLNGPEANRLLMQNENNAFSNYLRQDFKSIYFNSFLKLSKTTFGLTD